MGAAQGVDINYQTYEWTRLLEEGLQHLGPENFHLIRTVSRDVPVPRVIALREFDRLPQRHVRFSRTHIFMRDQYTCQYCRREFPKAQLNLDHVMPRSRGGRTSWENVVTSCHTCNRVKGSRTPQEAQMPLQKKPKRPAGSLGLLNLKTIHSSWQNFILLES